MEKLPADWKCGALHGQHIVWGNFQQVGSVELCVDNRVRGGTFDIGIVELCVDISAEGSEMSCSRDGDKVECEPCGLQCTDSNQQHAQHSRKSVKGIMLIEKVTC